MPRAIHPVAAPVVTALPTQGEVGETVVLQPDPAFPGVMYRALFVDYESGVPAWSIVGEKGDKGDKGDKGNKGDTGTAGTNGTNGTTGADGKSAYQVWLANGNTGDVNAYLASLKGAKGDSGEPSSVTSLPTSPVAGQVVDLVVDAAKGIVWRCKYDSAITGNSKWRVLGGRGFNTRQTAQNYNANSTAYTAVGNGMALPAVPARGVYKLDVTTQLRAGDGLGSQTTGVVGINGVEQSTAELFTGVALTTNGGANAVAWTARLLELELASGAVLSVMHYASGAGARGTAYGSMNLTPLLLG